MYIPKNKIITGLYTNGDEYIVEETNKFYTGEYYKLYNGGTYSGKTLTDPNSKRLIKPISSVVNAKTNSSTETISPLKYANLNIRKSNVIYFRNLNEVNKYGKLLPVNVYPSPTDNDYQIGIFVRYFVVKTNEIQYLEIDKNIYDQLVSQNEDWLWQLYTPFILKWTIVGDKLTVAKTNKNIVELTQRQIGKEGLTQFFQGDYLQFYKEDNTLNQTTSRDSMSPPSLPPSRS